MSAKKIGLVIACDGEKEFAQQMKNAQKETALLAEKMKILDEECSGSANTLENLQKKQELLTGSQKAAARALEQAQNGLGKAEDNYRKIGKQLAEYTDKLEEARKTQKKMEDAGETSSQAYKDSCREVQQLEKSVDSLRSAHTKEAGSITDWNKKITQTQRELNKANDAVEKNEKYLREAEAATDGCASSLDGFGREIEAAAEQMGEFAAASEEAGGSAASFKDTFAGAAIFKGVSTGTDFLMEQVSNVKEALNDISTSSADLAARTGATAQEMKSYEDVMLSIKGNNFGEDYRDISDAMSTVIQSMGDLNDTELQNVTESAITLRDTFGKDYQESIRAVDMLMSQFGITSEQAFNLIVQGTQQGLDKNGDLLDTINEYSVHYAQMGTTADEFFNSLQNGTDAGTFSVDKLGDAYKEFGIRVKDTATTTDEAYQILGLNADEMRTAFAEGGESAREASQTVLTALMSMDDKVKQNQAGVDLFGTMWEDLGISGVQALTNMEGEISSLGTAMEDLKASKYSDLESAMSGLGAAVQEKIVGPIKDVALPAITGLLQDVTELINPPKTKMQELEESLQKANDNLTGAMDKAKESMAGAEQEAAKVGILGEQLLYLNGIEEKSAAQKVRLKAVVQELGTYVPQVAQAYDEEAGKVALADEKILALIASKKELLVTEALEAAGKETLNALLEAQVALEQARGAKENAQERLDLMDKERQLYEDLYEAKMNVGKDPGDAFDTAQLELWNDALEKGLITYDEYNAALENSGATRWSQRALQMSDASLEAGEDVAKLTKEMNGLQETVDDCSKEYDSYSAAAEKVQEQYRGEAEAAEEAAEAVEEHGEKTVSAAETIRGAFTAVGDAVKEYAVDIAEQAIQAAEAAQAGAEAQKEAMQSLLDTYHGYADEIKADLQDKINVFDKFDADDKISTEDMLKNLQSQTEGLRSYKANMQTIVDGLGSELKPEFLQYLQDMGTEGANAVQALAKALEDGDIDTVKNIMNEYAEAMDLSEDIAETSAANRLAMEEGLGMLGSSEADFSDLRQSIEDAAASAAEGWTTLTDGTRQKLEEAIWTAQECGIQIPEGLADGIRNGEITSQEAISSLEGALEGKFDALVEIAKEQGVEITTELQAGIDTGGQAAVEAYRKLIQMIEDAATEADFSALRQSIEEASASAAEGWSGLTGETRSKLEETIQTVQECGVRIPKGLADGIRSGETTPEEAISTLNGELQNKFDGLVEEAKKQGLKIPAELQEGIDAGGEEAVAAYQELIQLLADKATEANEAGQQTGGEVAAGTSAGIEDGTSDVEASSTTMTEEAADASKEAASEFEEAGKAETEEYASGIDSGKPETDEAASSMARSAVKAVEMYQSQFRQAGENIPAGVAAGIRDGQSQAIKASAEMARLALIAAKKGLEIRSPSGIFKRLVGLMIPAGTAIGIKQGTPEAAKAAGSMVKETYNAAKTAAEKGKKTLTMAIKSQVSSAAGTETAIMKNAFAAAQKSAEEFDRAIKTQTSNIAGISTAAVKKALEESKKTIKELERTIKNQTTSIGKMTASASKIAQEATQKTIKGQTKVGAKAAQKALEEAKKTIEEQTAPGAMAIRNALAAATTIDKSNWKSQTGLAYSAKKKIENNFGVSKTEKTGDKTVKKDAEDYYGEVYQAASKFMSNQQVIRNISTTQELTYWKKVQGQLKKGTQAWYDATKQIKNLKQQAAKEAEQKKEQQKKNEEEKLQAVIDARKEQAAVQQEILDDYKTYYDVSEKAEMEYWDKARQQFAAGTDERIAADRKYLDAKQNWYSAQKNLDEEYAASSKQINDELEASVKELQNAYNNAVASRKQEILSSMSLFEAWDAEGYTGDILLQNLKTQVAGLAFWEQQLSELEQKVKSSDLIEELRAMGVDAAANIYSLNQMTADQLAEFESLYQKKQALAESQAIKENENLRQETNKQIEQLQKDAKDKLDKLNINYQETLAKMNEGIGTVLEGMLEKAGEIGTDTVSGLVAAIADTAESGTAYSATGGAVSALTSQLKPLEDSGKIIGENMLDALLGELTNRKKIEESASDAVDMIEDAMKDAADIHSPSRRFRENIGKQMAAGTGEGIAEGGEQAADNARQMIKDMFAASQAEMIRQQELMGENLYLPDFSGTARLNRMMEDVYKRPREEKAGNGTLETIIGTLTSAVDRLSDRLEGQDTGISEAAMMRALVKLLQPELSIESAAVANRKSRGVRW